jgi:hypothetical protein
VTRLDFSDGLCDRASHMYAFSNAISFSFPKKEVFPDSYFRDLDLR